MQYCISLRHTHVDLTHLYTDLQYSITSKLCVCSFIQLCPTLCKPHAPQLTRLHSPWNFPVKNTGVGVQVAISYSRACSQPMDQTRGSCISCISRQLLYHCATWEAPTSRLHMYYWYSFIIKYHRLLRKENTLVETAVEILFQNQQLIPPVGLCFFLAVKTCLSTLECFTLRGAKDGKRKTVTLCLWRSGYRL